MNETEIHVAGVRTRRLSVQAAHLASPRVVLLHGFADSADTWWAVLTRLEAAGVAACAVDLPGFGSADELRPGPILPQLDRFLDDLLADLGPVVLVGNSLGSCAAIRAAARHPHLVEAVVATDEPALARRQAMRMARSRIRGLAWWRLPGLVPKKATTSMLRRVLPRLLYGDPRAADPVVIERMVASLNTPTLGARLRQVRSLALETRDCYELGKVRCPVLVLHGADDRIIPVNASRRLHQLLPHSTFEILPTGHCPQLDGPDLVVDRLIAFLGLPREQRAG